MTALDVIGASAPTCLRGVTSPREAPLGRFLPKLAGGYAAWPPALFRRDLFSVTAAAGVCVPSLTRTLGAVAAEAAPFSSRFYERIRAVVIEEITKEIRALSHELEKARACGLDPRDDEMAKVAADLARLQAVIGQRAGT